MRNCFTPSTVAIDSIDRFHSTEWYLPDCANPNIFQFLPLQTELQGFSFTSSKHGVLITWTPEVYHLRSLFEKPRGADLWVHFHEHCADLANQFSSATMEVLWLPAPDRLGFDRVARINIYEDIRELVYETLHRAAGILRESNPTYGMIEEWDTADLERYTRLGLPKLLDAGLEVIGIANHFSHNMNTFGVSNMCCTVDHRIAESVGEANVKTFCDIAKSRGVAVEMWGNTALSTIALAVQNTNGDPQRIKFYPKEGTAVDILSRCAEPYIRNASNAIESDHYAPQFAAMNLRDSGVRRHWLDAWQKAHDQVGLERIFLDSSFNMSSDKFHWVANTQSGIRASATADQTHLLGQYRPASEPASAIRSQYHAHLEIVARMQEAGVHYCNEDLGVFGVHRHGPGADARLTNLFMWNECLVSFDIPAILKRNPNADLEDVFFRGLAYRMVWMIYWDAKIDSLSFAYSGVKVPQHVPKAHHLEVIGMYKAVRGRMVERHVLPDEAGVVYRDGHQAVLWAFDDLNVTLACPAHLEEGGSSLRTEAPESSLHASKRSIHKLDFASTVSSIRLADLVRVSPREIRRSAAVPAAAAV